MIAPSPLALKFAPWSISKCQTAEQCPSKFEHQYILKSPKLPPSDESRVGNIVHSILEFRCKGDTADEAWLRALTVNKVEEREEPLVRQFSPAIERFIKRYSGFLEKNQIENVYYECEIAITADGKLTGYWDKNAFFRGKIDIMCSAPDGTLYIIDHKSGKVPSAKYMDKYLPQLQSYVVMGDKYKGPFEKVKYGIHFLKADDVNCMYWFPSYKVKSVWEQYCNELIASINTAAEGLEPPFMGNPNTPFPCEYCDYRTICSYYASRPEDTSDLLEYATNMLSGKKD